MLESALKMYAVQNLGVTGTPHMEHIWKCQKQSACLLKSGVEEFSGEVGVHQDHELPTVVVFIMVLEALS